MTQPAETRLIAEKPRPEIHQISGMGFEEARGLALRTKGIVARSQGGRLPVIPVIYWGRVRLDTGTQELLTDHREPIDLTGGNITVKGDSLFFSAPNGVGDQETVVAFIRGQLVKTAFQMPS